MIQFSTLNIITWLLMCGVILCVPIEVSVSDSSVYTSYEPSNGETTDNESQEDALVKISLLEPSEKTRESVNLEYEAIPSKVLTKYDFSHKKLAYLTNPTPVIDSITESEKYGNNGDKFDGISRAIVNGYETFSNFLNKLIGKPKEITSSISKGITAQLDIIGGKLVGL